MAKKEVRKKSVSSTAKSTSKVKPINKAASSGIKATASPQSAKQSGKVNSNFKKLKVNKLEERIAPSMIGGTVDPGMAEGMQDTSQTDTATSSTQQTSTTSVDSTSQSYTNQNSGETGSYTNTQSGDYQEPTNYDNHEGEEGYQSENGSYQDLNSDSANSDAGYVQEEPAWREPDWVTPNADGSVTVVPPEGVSVTNGLATFPVDVANSSLPTPDGVEIQDDGSVNVELPKDAEYLAESNTVTLPADSNLAQNLPQNIESFPVGEAVVVSLPEQGVTYDAQANTLNISNEVVNEMLPENIEIQDNGSVAMELPPDTEMNDDGSFELSADAASYLDHPPSEIYNEVDFAEVNSDGSVTCELPEGADLSDGVATFPHDLAVAELPIPDDVTLNSDGTMDIAAPEGSTYDVDSNTLTFDAQYVPQDAPDAFQFNYNEDGTAWVALPDGVEFNAEQETIHLDNYWANEIVPDNIEIHDDGSVAISLPEQTEYSSDGSEFTIPAEYNDFYQAAAPEFVSELNYATAYPDGSYLVTPPESFEVSDGSLVIPHEAIVDPGFVPIPEGITVNADGTLTAEAPEGTTYNATAEILTFPPGEFHAAELPDGINGYANEDGSFSIQLPDGITYNEAAGTVNIDNYWANEIAPAPIEIHDDGSMTVSLPTDTQFNADGSFVIPEYQADFLEHPAPEFVQYGPEWINTTADGSVVAALPAEIGVNESAGTITIPADIVNEQFESYLPEYVTLNADGTFTAEVPEGTVYNADANMLTVPAGEINFNEVPENIDAHVNPDGSLSIILPEGITYDAAAGTVHLDNYWSNEVAPNNYEINTNGTVDVYLPEGAHLVDDNLVIPADQVQNFESTPEYIQHGPEWIEATPDGSVNVSLDSDEVTVNQDAGVVSCSCEFASEHFESYIPHEVTFNDDGTLDYKVPSGTTYNDASGVVTIPADSWNMDQVPRDMHETLNLQVMDNGNYQLTLPEGMDYNSSAGTIHLSNEWVNEATPDYVAISPDGTMSVQLPEQTHFYDGGFTIPADYANFLETPAPDFVHDVDFGVAQPDGSYTFTLPEDIRIEDGQVEIPHDAIAEYIPIPDGVQINNDGTIDLETPAGTVYNAQTDTLTLPAGEIHINELPAGMEAVVNANGSISIQLPDGMEYNAADQTVHLDNYWANEIAPAPVEIQEDGSLEVTLPNNVAYNEGGSFTIPADSADFIQDPMPEYVVQGPDWVAPNGDGSVAIMPPAGININADTGVMSMPVAAAYEHFEGYIPEGVTINADGSADVAVPEGTQYNAGANQLTFPVGSMHMAEIPEGINAQLNADGAIVVTLPEGMSYNAGTGEVHMSNTWVNQFTPEPCECRTDGTVHVTLPEGTQYYPAPAPMPGEPMPAPVTCVIPAESVVFMEAEVNLDGAATTDKAA